MGWTSPEPGRLILPVVYSQSNATGIASLLSSAPADNNRNDTRCLKRDANRDLVVASEPLHLGIETALVLTGGSADGFSWVKPAANAWLDYAPTKTAVIIPRGVGGTRLVTQWRTSPEDPYTKRAIDDSIIGGLSANDRVCFLVYKGETEAAIGGTGAEVTGFAANMTSRLAFARTRIGRPNAPAIICDLQHPGPLATWPDWDDVQAQIATLASAVDPKCTVVVNSDLGNQLHITAASHIILGAQVGSALISLIPDWTDS